MVRLIINRRRDENNNTPCRKSVSTGHGQNGHEPQRPERRTRQRDPPSPRQARSNRSIGFQVCPAYRGSASPTRCRSGHPEVGVGGLWVPPIRNRRDQPEGFAQPCHGTVEPGARRAQARGPSATVCRVGRVVWPDTFKFASCVPSSSVTPSWSCISCFNDPKFSRVFGFADGFLCPGSSALSTSCASEFAC